VDEHWNVKVANFGEGRLFWKTAVTDSIRKYRFLDSSNELGTISSSPNVSRLRDSLDSEEGFDNEDEVNEVMYLAPELLENVSDYIHRQTLRKD